MTEEQQITPEEYLEYQDQQKEEQEELKDESQDDQNTINPELMEMYGDAPPEFEVKNKDSFLHKAGFNKEGDTLRTSFLTVEELGRPMFSVRFLLDLHKLAKYYLDPVVFEINKDLENEIKVANDVETYIQGKIENITSSGMSNEGFLTNLTASKRIEISRKKNYDKNIENLQGGKKKK